MSFDIIKLKQDMLRISNDIHFDKIQNDLNADFASFLQASTWTAPQVELLTNIQNKLLNQFKHNTELVNATVNQPSALVQRDDAFEFTALLPLQNFQSQIGHYPKKIKDKINKLTKKIISLQRNYVKFAAANENLSDARAGLNGQYTQPLIDIIQDLKDMPVSTRSYNESLIMQKNLPSYIDDELRRELKKIAKNFEKDKRPLEVKLVPFQEFLAKRWNLIRETPRAYCVAPNDDFNVMCLELATAMANATPDLGRFSLLMPSVTVVQSDVTDNYFDDPNVKLEQIILNSDESRFIEVESCLALAEKDAVLKHTTLVNQQMEELDANEESTVINHSVLTQQYYKAIVDLRNFTTGKYDKALIKPPGVYLNNLADQLEKGGAYHIDPTAGLLPDDARLATHNNAGEAANVGILEFSEYMDSLPELEKDKLFQLRAMGASENFGQLWRRLSTPDAPDLTDTRNCVELIAPQIRTILEQNRDLHNVLDFTIEQFEQSLATAKAAFQDSIHSDYYPLKPIELEEHQQHAIDAALTDAMLAKEPELALKLVALGANPDDRVQRGREKIPLLRLAVELDQGAVIEKLLQQPVSEQVLREALFAAIQANNTDAALKILDHPISVANSVGGDKREHFILLTMKQHNPAILKKLLQRGANRGYKDEHGLTLLHNFNKMEAGKYNSIDNRLNLLFTFLDNPEVLDNQNIGYTFASLMPYYKFPWKDNEIHRFIMKYKDALADPVNKSYIDFVLKDGWNYQESFLKEEAIREQLPWLIKPILVKDYSLNNRDITDFMYAVKNWSDAGKAELLGDISPYLHPDNPHIVGNKTYYFEYLLTRPLFQPLTARKLFDLGADPNVGNVFQRLVRKGEDDLALHIIASEKLTAKTILDAQQLPKLNVKIEKELYKALANVYEANNNKIIGELQIIINANQSMVSALFKQENSGMLNKALTKLIAQIKSQEVLGFSAQEIAALRNVKVASILKAYKKNKDIPVYLLKANSHKELDYAVQARRGVGDTPLEKVSNTVMAFEVDLRQQQDRLIARLNKNTDPAVRGNINIKLDAIMLAQKKLIEFSATGGKDLPGFIRDISAARDQARKAKPVTHLEYAMKSAKGLFKKHGGDSDTAGILNKLVNELNKLDKEMVKENKRKLG